MLTVSRRSQGVISTRRRGAAENRIFGPLLGLLAFTLVAVPAAGDPSHTLSRSYVPDDKTAIAIAEAVLPPIYGNGIIAKERPFHAVLRSNVWIVSGSLPRGWVGGTAEVRISKDDGRIMRVTHGK